MTFQDILKIFEENDNFLILTHKSPDGDTLGSGFALSAFLRDMGKKANVVNSDSFPKRYDLIYESYYPQEFDVKYVIAVDIADTNLLGSNLSKYAEEGAIDLCIDHHISNKYFAKQSYVEADASAAALIMYKIFKASGRNISRQIARCLYTGIATDTGCFKYENTTPQAHIACAELMSYGIDFAYINRKMFDVKSKGRLMVEQSVTANMEYYCGGKCSMIVLTKELMEKSCVDAVSHLVFYRIFRDMFLLIGITVKQRHENVFKISVRSDDEIDASAFCREFGGGGHIRAAGCEITGSLEEVKAKLLKQAEKVLG